MAVVQQQSTGPHTGVFLPPKPRTADNFWSGLSKTDKQVTEEVRQYYDQNTGGQQSYTDRTVTIYFEGNRECLAIGAKVSTTVQEVRDLLAVYAQVDAGTLTIRRKTVNGPKVMRLTEEVPSTIFVGGIKTLARKRKEYEHHILVVGAGLAGIQCMIDLHLRDRWDIVCMDRNEDFGGHSWIKVPNKFTKLQTERGTYSVEYCLPDAPVPTTAQGVEYKTWPSRDLLLAMMREGAKKHGLYDHTMFQTTIEKVTPKQGSYAIQYLPTREEDGDANMLLSSVVSCWPGFLHDPNLVEFLGEDDFDGYIEYSSFDKVDYSLCTGKVCLLYGHGAFTIENVRTLCEHRCKKCWVLCRTRNLSGTKMASWLVGFLPRPLPALVLLDAFKRMYDLVGYDLWSCYSVKTDQGHTTASIEQKTIFGVTDIYFLAGYYGLMEVVVDEVKRLTHHTVHTKSGVKINTEVFIKAIGTKPSFKVDKQMGIKHVAGFWVNGDPLRPVWMGFKGVQAKNFGSFSIGPGLAPAIKILNYFIEYPDDWWLVADKLPINKAGTWPAFVAPASYGTPVFMTLNMSLPLLAVQTSEADAIKARKQGQAHPLEVYLGQCKKEWEHYIQYFRNHNMVDDRPDPPYPYTIEVMKHLINKAETVQNGGKVVAD